jgi:DUF438 domain-containing protein
MDPTQVLFIRCRTLDKRLDSIENADTGSETSRLAVVASKLADRILEMTPKDAFTREEYENIQIYLDQFSFAVYADNMKWARELVEKIRALIRNRSVLF